MIIIAVMTSTTKSYKQPKENSLENLSNGELHPYLADIECVIKSRFTQRLLRKK